VQCGGWLNEKKWSLEYVHICIQISAICNLFMLVLWEGDGYLY
jgi:hypothetical protein